MSRKTETRNVSGFNEVSLRGYGDISIQQGEHEGLVIEAEEEVLPTIKSEVQGQRLVLSFKSWLDYNVPKLKPIHYQITMKEVKGISISGSGTLNAASIQTDKCSLNLSGSGQMGINHLEAQDLEISISGSGKMELEGKVQRQDIHISGSGNLISTGLDSQESNIRISGSGQVALKVQQVLKVGISGIGQVEYIGNPRVSQRISGAGRIQAIS